MRCTALHSHPSPTPARPLRPSESKVTNTKASATTLRLRLRSADDTDEGGVRHEPLCSIHFIRLDGVHFLFLSFFFFLSLCLSPHLSVYPHLSNSPRPSPTLHLPFSVSYGPTTCFSTVLPRGHKKNPLSMPSQGTEIRWVLCRSMFPSTSSFHFLSLVFHSFLDSSRHQSFCHVHPPLVYFLL